MFVVLVFVLLLVLVLVSGYRRLGKGCLLTDGCCCPVVAGGGFGEFGTKDWRTMEGMVRLWFHRRIDVIADSGGLTTLRSATGWNRPNAFPM
jgi:hypothetical protein